MARFKKNNQQQEEGEQFDRLLDDFVKEMDGEVITTEVVDDEKKVRRMCHQEIAEDLADIGLQQGWENFKARMDEMLTRCQVGCIRAKAGLGSNLPRLHTALIGNPGTGKTKAVQLMATLYKDLGLLDSDEVYTVRVSTLASGGINGESESVVDAVKKARGGILAIDRAHELYKTENKGGYDSESRIVRSLVDCLNNKDRYKNWMLVLLGEPEGMESLLSCYPDLRECISEPIYLEDFKPEELYGMFDICCNERKVRLSEEARTKLEMYVLHQYNRRSPGFPNAWLIRTIFDESIIPAMFRRLNGIRKPTKKQLQLVLPEDIPSVGEQKDDALARLDELIGLGQLKSKVKDFLYSVKLARRRMEVGLPTNMPRLHMAFLGNPGTGKTTR